MAGRKKNTEIRYKAFQDYLDEMPIDDIAKKYNRPVPCVENWRNIDDWCNRKEEAEQEVLEKVLRKFKKSIETNSENFLAGLNIVNRIARKRLEKLEEKLKNSENDEEDSKSILGWSRLLVDTGFVEKNLVPAMQVGGKKASSNLQTVLQKLMK
mgnify:CR=1 FL=1